nr:MAG: ORF1 [Torque teno midi virus]
MPFYWRRRKRWWNTRWRKRRQFRKYKRPRRRFQRRYKGRRSTRRRRRRRGKVRRKKKTIPIRQWQPDCIRKCKIKGISVHVLGSQGKQFACFTDNAKDWTPPLQPGGGGFGVEKYTLQYLYEENRNGNNIWTQSNKYLDLVRYFGGKITFWRHSHIDFIASYSRTLPMNLNNYTYPDTYPQAMMLARHKKFIPSLKTKPHGSRKVTIKFKPPKILTNKWFFQESLANTGLLQLQTTICDLRYPHLGCCNTNELVSLVGLNLNFYKNFAWGNPNNVITPTQQNNWYIPYNNAKKTLTVTLPNGTTKQIKVQNETYKQSVNIATGWFQPDLLKAIKISEEDYIPTTVARYNPTRDTGVGSKVWLASVLNSSYLPPRTDKDLILEGLPLYQLLFGFTNYIQKIKKDTTFLESYCLFIQSTALEPQHGTHHIYCPIDQAFINGKGAYDSYATQWQQEHWFPTLSHQLKSINNIVMSGPFIPKLENIRESTWELWSNYTFYFKFGGASLPDAETANPGEQGTYPIPNTQQQAIQVCNPEKASPYTTLHSWDFRRGIITSKAFKRMCENQETDTDFQADGETPQKKRKVILRGNALQAQEEEIQEIQSCLHSLCEENTCQDFQEKEDLLLLIQQQQQQQQQIKQHLLKLIIDLKNKQKLLQLQTGVLE